MPLHDLTTRLSLDHLLQTLPSSVRLSNGSSWITPTTPSDTQPVSAAALPLPAGAATEATLAAHLTSATFTGRINTQGQKSMAASTPVVLASDQSAIPVTDNSGSLTVDSPQLPAALVAGRLSVDGSGVTQPVSAASLPLPAGAATETTLGTRLADATFTARVNTLGVKVAAASMPVVLASDQAALPVTDNAGSLTVDSSQLPGALVGGRLDANNGAWIGSTAPTVGQKTMAASLPIAIASDQPALPISAAALPLPTGAATETTLGARLADATFTGRINTLGQKAMAASMPVVVASDQGALPISAAALPLPAGAAQEHATAASPLSARLSDGAAFYTSPAAGQLPPALVGGRLDENIGSWMGSTAPTVGQKAMASSLPVVVSSDQTNLPDNLVQIAGSAVLTGGVAGLLAVAGHVLHDGVDAGGPQKIGGRAQDALPAVVSAVNDRVDAWLDRRGRLHVTLDDHTSTRVGIYAAHSGALLVTLAAHAATAGYFWLINPVGSTVLVALRRALLTAYPVTALVCVTAPRITLERVTFTGAPSGATITPAQRDSTDTAPQGSVRTASTGLTLTQGAVIGAGIVPAVMSAAGTTSPTQQDLMRGLPDDFVVLRAGQGVVVRQTVGGTTSDTRTVIVDLAWEEYT